MSGLLYTVTVDAVPDPVEFTYTADELDLPPNASAEQAVSHVAAKIHEDPTEFVLIPYKLLVTVVRSVEGIYGDDEGDSCHTSLVVQWPTEEEYA